jgi:high-affinity nickel-transport protein
LSLLVSAFGLARLLSADIAAWCEGKELLFGGAVVIVVAASFAISLWLTRTGWASARTALRC